jgi:hypothetical protein
VGLDRRKKAEISQRVSLVADCFFVFLRSFGVICSEVLRVSGREAPTLDWEGEVLAVGVDELVRFLIGKV